ncbi:WecB/TagA/CpsF family glycosyltransferase [Chitinispirillales bacterium ANBcel5]|uniref:WecB/TagA/CpsF family glycosyltransferase n=1 Tax=Cellulosispirillum alkaliphilum TaxID=3039283 RepID=UPI002A53463E|nr:WecB/TagA/CpsF family glycosyltransferase [Chitinispirillales bacterium ANBcel5]
MKRVPLLNLYVDSTSMDGVVENLFERIEHRIKSSVFFVNALKAYEIDKDSKLLHIMNSFDFVLADGMPLVWISKWLGEALPGRVNGTDLFERLLKEAESRDKSVYFLGAKEENLNQMIEVVKKRYPNLQIAGWRNGYFNGEENSGVVDGINKSGADILFLGFGSPKKELWAYENMSSLSVSVVQGVGGSFDVLSGLVKRAPKWMQKCGLEWFYRFCKEPRRMFKRYLITNTFFIALFLKCYCKELKSKVRWA